MDTSNTDIVEMLLSDYRSCGFCRADRQAGANEIARLRAALREIRGWREIGRDDRMKVIEEICEKALGDE